MLPTIFQNRLKLTTVSQIYNEIVTNDERPFKSIAGSQKLEIRASLVSNNPSTAERETGSAIFNSVKSLVSRANDSLKNHLSTKKKFGLLSIYFIQDLSIHQNSVILWFNAEIFNIYRQIQTTIISLPCINERHFNRKAPKQTKPKISFLKNFVSLEQC